MIVLPKVLLTGYEPFDGYSVNPSAELVKVLHGTRFKKFELLGKVLPLDYSQAYDELISHIDKYSPEIVLLCGQANRAAITIERIGLNAQSTTREDNYGNKPESDVIDPEAPAAYFSTLNPTPLVEALREAEIPADVSYHAGLYGCNWILFKLLRWNNKNERNIKTAFIHVLPLPSQAIEKSKYDLATMELDTLVSAFRIILKNLS